MTTHPVESRSDTFHSMRKSANLIDLTKTASGIVLRVKAHAGARRNGITGEHDGSLKVSVTQAPEKGKANKALAKVIAKELELKASQVSLVSGATSNLKSFSIAGVELEELNNRVQARLQS